MEKTISMTVFYSSEYSTPCGFDTTAKSRCVADLIQIHLSNVVNLTSPAPATQRELEQIHKKEYLENIFQGKTKILEIQNSDRAFHLLDRIKVRINIFYHLFKNILYLYSVSDLLIMILKLIC
jgi:acetoin utilization deacetylase AcuC-like enzyme